MSRESVQCNEIRPADFFNRIGRKAALDIADEQRSDYRRSPIKSTVGSVEQSG